MEDTKDKQRTEVFLSLDSETVKELRIERVETGLPVNRIVDEILRRHFERRKHAGSRSR